MEVRVQNLKSILLISTMDDTKRSSGVEPVPVGSLGNPLEIVLEECVVGGVSIHHSVGPDCGSVKN